MFYPTTAIHSLMPDALLPEIERKMGNNHRTRMGYFTRFHLDERELKEIKRENKTTENNDGRSNYEATKGVLPVDMMMHPNIEYNYRGENVLLNGLETSSNRADVNNGTWRP